MQLLQFIFAIFSVAVKKFPDATDVLIKQKIGKVLAGAADRDGGRKLRIAKGTNNTSRDNENGVGRDSENGVTAPFVP